MKDQNSIEITSGVKDSGLCGIGRVPEAPHPAVIGASNQESPFGLSSTVSIPPGSIFDIATGMSDSYHTQAKLGNREPKHRRVPKPRHSWPPRDKRPGGQLRQPELGLRSTRGIRTPGH